MTEPNQRKITRYLGAILKVIPCHGDRMKWFAILPDRGRLYDSISTIYSIKGMTYYLRCGADVIHDYFVYEHRRKAGLDTVNILATHDPKGFNRLTREERLVRKSYLLRGKIRFGNGTKISYNSQRRPQFKAESVICG